jgi:uncharacterized protein
MPSQNVEAVRRATEAFNRRDMEAMLREADPNVELSDPERTGAGPYLGHESFVRWIEEWLDEWESYESDTEALVEVSDKLVAFVHHHGKARASGLEIDHRGANLYGLTDGRIASYRPYTHRADALEAAGLEDGANWRAAIEMLIQSYRAWNDRDVEAMLRNAHPDAELVPIPQSPDLTVAQGGEGLAQFLSSVFDIWQELEIEPLLFTPAGDRVLVDVAVKARARDSGIELEEEWAHVWTLREGKVDRIQGFAARGEALQALALS